MVLSATDATGAARTDVKVTVDGASFALSLDGGAVPMNPGTHKFRFAFADGKVVEKDVVVAQGQKDQAISGAQERAAIVAPGTSGGTTERGGASGFPWRTAGWVTAGVGSAGLVAGIVFGLIVGSDKTSANCNPKNQCLPGPLSDARTMATAADIAFVAGGVLAAGGLATVIWGPKEKEGLARVRVAPAVGQRGAGVVAGGSF